MGLAFVFDEAKSHANKLKHGIDFVQAQALWLDPNRVIIGARTGDEQRFIVIGTIGGQQWSAVVTYRGHTIRLISVRRSRAKEVQIYESE